MFGWIYFNPVPIPSALESPSWARIVQPRTCSVRGVLAKNDTVHSVGTQDLTSRDKAPAWGVKPAISASDGIRSRSDMRDAYEAISEYELNGDKLDSCLQVLPADVERENRLSRKFETATERERGDR